MQDIEAYYKEFIAGQAERGLRRGLTDIQSRDGRMLRVDGQDYINFSSNDYLGLSRHPSLIERAQEWAEKYGAGCGASRLVTGNLEIFSTLEEKLAKFKRREAAIIMASGFQANASVLPALFDKKTLGTEPLVFSDKLNHASMHLGCAAASIKQIRYHHNDMVHLKELLERHTQDDRPKFILSESVFSMDGDIAPLDNITALAKRYNAFTIIDEAHSTGIMGDHGQGIAHQADVVIGTFSKAFGAFGAYIACSQNIKDYLVNKCAGLVYATALPPQVLGAIDAALEMIPDINEERARSQKMSDDLRAAATDLGFDCGQSQTQIVPVIIGDNETTLRASAFLKEHSIWASAIRPPTVPANSARLRFTITTAHTDNDLEKLIEVLPFLKTQKAAA